MGNRFRDQYEGQLILAYIVFILIWSYLTIPRLFGSSGTETFWGMIMFAILLIGSFSFIGFFNGSSAEVQKLYVEPEQTRASERRVERNNHKQKVKKRKERHRKNNR